jgi:hypothetical protein
MPRFVPDFSFGTAVAPAGGGVTHMSDPRNVQGCRWAEPTIFQENPLWTAAEDYPWSCKADGDPRVVEDTGRCETCGRWAPRGPRLAERPETAERCHCKCDSDCCK